MALVSSSGRGGSDVNSVALRRHCTEGHHMTLAVEIDHCRLVAEPNRHPYVDSSPSRRLPGQLPGQLLGDPGADRVVAAGQEPGVVGVQALDARSGAADAAVWSRAGVIRRQGCVPLGGVAGVSVGDQRRIDLGLGAPNAAGGLEPADGENLAPAHEPVAGGHRLAVGAATVRCGAPPGPCVVAHHDLERALGRPAEQLADGSDIVAHVASDG